MSWKKVEIASFLKERKGRFKPEDKEIQDLQRIEKIDFSGNIFLSEKSSKTNMIIVKNGDLVISGINVAKGAMAIYSGKEAVKATIHYSSYIYDKGRIDIDFLRHFLKSQTFINAIKEQIPGGIKTEIKPKHILPLKVFIPTDINEQRKIVKILNNRNSVVYDISTELTHQLNLVKKLRQAFLREAMQGKLVEQNPNDEPATELLAKIKAEKEQLIKEKKIKKQKPLPPITEEEIPFEIPDNWVWCRLGEITTYGSSQKADPNKFNNDTWVLDLEDIEKETSRLLNKVRFNERNSLSTKSVFEFGDVLYSKLRPYLDKVIVADENGVCTTEILPLKCFANTNPYFFRYALKRPDFISFVNSVTKGMKMPRLGTEEGRKALIPFPPLSEQKRIVAKLDELMAYCDSLEESIKNSQTQNEMLLGQVLREALEPKEITIKEEVL